METQRTPVTRRRTISIGRDREEELEEVARASARAVLDETEGDGMDEDDSSDFTSKEDFEEKLQDDVKSIAEENPFMIGEQLEEAGIPFEYKIKKGGKHFVTLDEANLSEDVLGKRYGGGTYTVSLYQLSPKRLFKKQMTFRIAEPPMSVNQERKTNETHLTELMLKQNNEQLKAIEDRYAEKERRLEDDRKEEKKRYEEERKLQADKEERRETERRDKEMNGKNSLVEALEVLTKIMPRQEAPKDNSDKFMEMMMKMQENTQKLIEKMDDKNKEMMKESKSEMKELIEKLGSKKSDGVSERELREAIDKARREGKEDYKELVEMAEVKAIERAELLSGREPIEKEPESMTDTIIKSALPMLMQGMMKKPAPMLAPRRQAPPQRRALPVQTTPQAPRPIQTAPQAPRPIVKTPVQTVQSTTAPQAPKTPTAQNMTLQTGGMQVMDLSSINLSHQPKAAKLPSKEEKEAVGQLLMQIVGAGIVDGADPLEVSNLAYHALKTENLLSNRVFDYYPKSDLIALKDQFGLEVDNNWIDTFYADFKEKFNTIG